MRSCEQSRDRLDVWFLDVVPLDPLIRRERMYLCISEGCLSWAGYSGGIDSSFDGLMDD
jgi:hypothetical protein